MWQHGDADVSAQHVAAAELVRPFPEQCGRAAVGVRELAEAVGEERDPAGPELGDEHGEFRMAVEDTAEHQRGEHRLARLHAHHVRQAHCLGTAGCTLLLEPEVRPARVEVQAAFGCSILVIEHDMPMVMSLSDRMYCLEAGSVITEGSPDAVRNDPLVIAAYLGTDERTINRSDTGRAAETIAGA